MASAAYMKRYWETHPEYREATKQRNKGFSQRRRAMVAALKDVPCTDCGLRYPSYVMHFDHVKEGKVLNIANSLMILGRLDRLLDEIAKCEVVCANCHAERTNARKF